MKILYGYKNAAGAIKDPVAAIGIFDGVHVGHKRIISKVLGPRNVPGDRIVITFDPHPQAVLSPEKTPPRIMSLDHRLSLLEKMGLDAVVVIRFSDFIAMMSPAEFVKSVLGAVGARKIYVGSNFHFGRGRSGDVNILKDIAAKYGIDVRIVNPVKTGRRVVSSTWLRKLIRSGDLGKAELLLRRPVSVYGTVVKGDERGKSLGVPTANIDPHQEVIPPPGVYAVKVDADGRLYDGVLNIGFSPTFYGRSPHKREEPRIEVHIIGFEGDIYGKNVEIFFIKRLRREKRFRSERDLVARINKDIESAKKILSHKGRTLSRIHRYRSHSRRRPD